jgi:hypothetical protein
LSWDLPSCRLSVEAARSTNSVLVLRKQWWRIWPMQHHPPCWIYSWFIPHEELPRVSEAVIFRERDGLELRRSRCCFQPNGQWRLRIYEVWDSVSGEEVFFRGFSCWPRVLMRWFLPQGTVLLFFHLLDFFLYYFNLFFCFVQLF